MGVITSGLLAATTLFGKGLKIAGSPVIPVTILFGLGLSAKFTHKYFFKDETLQNIELIIDRIHVIEIFYF
jgi:hypothetical protein